MFYMPVPDPNSTINGELHVGHEPLERRALHTRARVPASRSTPAAESSSTTRARSRKSGSTRGSATSPEELLYYKVSGNAPGANIDLALVTSTPEQLDAANTYQLQNFLRLKSYMVAPETNSPYSQVDGLAMRGAIWQLLRYSQDQKGGTQRATWYPLVNTTLVGQANFNAAFGSITTKTHDWSIAQIADDAGLSVAANFTNPSWNFRSMLPPLNGGSFPLFTHPLSSSPLTVTLNGGGSSYIRFRVLANTTAVVSSTSSSSAVPSTVDLTLVRTQ